MTRGGSTGVQPLAIDPKIEGSNPVATQHREKIAKKKVLWWSAVFICGMYYKSFTIVIYDHNDSGQYYKTMITIVIYDHS